jgi:hypothetical protein
LKRAQALSGILLSAAFLSACGGKPETPATPASQPGVPPSAPAASDPATPAAGSPNPAAAPAATGLRFRTPAVAPRHRCQAVANRRAKLFAEVGKFTLTEAHVDKIGRVDTALAEFWANPTERARIRASTHVDKVIAEIEKTPVFVKALAAEKISARDYLIGTFSMIGGYSYVVVVAQNPEAANHGPAPVNAAPLEDILKRFNDDDRSVRPPAK